ncbi:MAG TPA: hypothetical protein VLC92_02390 [Rhodocyclaceae bacterium]|nr:hypothetical protein [Rhodocyclaceae bacterium]
MALQFQIVFQGKLLDGFELAAVKASAARRLKATPEQVDRLFSGKRAILKKNLPDDTAQRYAGELRRIGMLVVIEPELVKTPAPDVDSAMHDPIGEISIASTAPIARSEAQRVTSRDEPLFDPMKTQLANIADSVTPLSSERWPQPAIAISQKQLSSTQPTIAMRPRSSNDAAEPTIVVTPGAVSNTSAKHEACSAPTIIVPPRQSAASDPTIIVRANPTLPPADKNPDDDAGFDSEKTLIANNEAIESYLSPDSAEIMQPTPVPRTQVPTTASATGEEVQCPTCGDKQPKRVYCRRCGHALSLPPKQASMGESTITKKAFTPLPKRPAVNEETVLVPQHDEPQTKSAAKSEFLAAPTWLTIGLMFVLLLAVAGWLLFA